jgi:2-iminobutanoate/2-iminopropanoate deaminase
LILQNISAILKKGGSDLIKVFKVNIFLVNPEDFAPMNQVYETFFSKPFPVRSSRDSLGSLY